MPPLNLAAGALLPSALLALVTWLAEPAIADWQRREAAVMGTSVTVEVYHQDREIARQGIETALQEMRRIEATMSPYIESSELARLNTHAASAPVRVSKELFELIRQSLYFSRLTDGAFDITFASVGYLYDYRNGKRPDAAQLQRATPLIDYRNLVLDEKQLTVSYSKPGVRIDLGGIAKGYAVDRCLQLLKQMGVEHALVTAGGDSAVAGDRLGRPWTIGVRHPRDREELVAVIPLVDVAVSTSGDYERFFKEDGIRYHHIIDPASGDSARALRSVTIIGADATTTDALSTSVFILGPEEGLALIDNLPDIDAILIDRNGRLLYSAGLARMSAAGEGRYRDL
jgi:thiamine biosynthesis lipoprotein